MASKTQLGISFGSNSLSIVETAKQRMVNFFDASHSLFDDPQSSLSQSIPDDIRLTAIIQKSLRDKKIENQEVNLSLPAKDIILRSFYIPWMTSSEIKGVIDFEARRYIPFKLEELVYDYHTVTITEKKIRRIRVLFIAIRKEILARYHAILEQGGLKVISVEPSPISLLRTLTFKKHIQRNQKIAIIQTNQKEGAITIIDDGIPQFVRDFRLSPGANTMFDLDPVSLSTQLLNEVRISLDYYRRQHSGGEIHKLLLISSNTTNNLAETLSKDLGITATTLSARTILNLDDEVDIGALNAFGISLRTSFSFPVKINLSRAPAKAQEPEKVFEQTPVNYFTTIKLSGVCASLLLFAFILANGQVSLNTKKLANLSKREGVYSGLNVSDLKKKQDDINLKLNSYKNVRQKSNAAFFLSRIPNRIPDGLWLTNFSIAYEDTLPAQRLQQKKDKISQELPKTITKITVDLNGYSFHQDQNQQISQVNNFVENLKNDPEISVIFNDISLKNVKKQTLDEQTVTSFQVTCK